MSAPVWSLPNQIAWNYICVIDASLTELTFDIYKYNNTATIGLPLLELEATKVLAGLGSVVKLPGLKINNRRHEGFDDDDEDEDEEDGGEEDEGEEDKDHEDQDSNGDNGPMPEDEEAKLEEILDSIISFSKDILPKQQLARTPLFFYGTGNVRSLDVFNKHKLMRGACTYLQQHSDLVIKDCSAQVSTMHEDVEGLLTWIAVNYEKSTLSKGLSSDTGSIVLNNGGSSVAYYETVGKSEQYKVAVAGSMFDVHVDSNDGLGLGDAWDIYSSTKDSSCYNPGWGSINGTGSYDECAKSISFLLEDAPSVPAKFEFHASGEWSLLSSLFDSEASAREFCATQWSEIDTAKYAGVKNLERLCFDVVYAQNLESKLFEEAPMTPLLDYSSISWTKGRALLYAASELSGATTGIQANSGASTWQFSNDVKRPKLGDWVDRIDSKSHRAYGGLVFLAVLGGILYLLLGKNKRQHIKRTFWNRIKGYKNISVDDFELDDRRTSEDEFEVV